MDAKTIKTKNQKFMESIGESFLDIQKSFEVRVREHLDDSLYQELHSRMRDTFNNIIKYIQWVTQEFDSAGNELKHLDEEKTHLKKRTSYFKTLYEKGLDLASENDISRLLEIALDTVITLSGAERGFITILGENNTYDFQAAREIDEKEIADPSSQISQTIMNEVLRYGGSVSSGDISEDSKFRDNTSVIRLNLKSVICLPLMLKNKVFGAIYLDNNNSNDAFDLKSMAVLQTFSVQISKAVESALHVKKLEMMQNSFLRAASAQIKFHQIIGNSPSLNNIFGQLLKVAPTDATVLILGESGTGKELIAHAIHDNSGRAEEKFIALNCSAIPTNLLESELFGHEKGAFTGATSRKIGKFEAADKGTLFLDEIGEMSPDLQVKLLRILQTMELQVLGSNETKKINVRILAATNKPLKEKVALGEFRNDLYYRLNVFAIEMPPLRNRKEDIPTLVYHFLSKYKERHKKNSIDRISAEVFEILGNYSWPGNVRELENVIERAIILCQENVLNYTHLPPEISSDFKGVILTDAFKDGSSFEEMVNGFKRRIILSALEEYNNNMTDVAKSLQLNRSYLYRLAEKLGIGI